MSFWTRKKSSGKPTPKGDRGRVQKAKKTVKRSPPVAMELTGHKTEAVYRRYAIVSESDLSDGVKKLESLLRTDLSEPRKILPYTARKIS